MKGIYARAVCLALIVVVSGCGGGSSGGGSSGGGGGGGNTLYSIGGTLSGLASGQSVVLQDNGGDNLTVSANGAFTFATQVSGTYAVSVLTQPTGQSCTVSGGSGTATANVTSVAVACVNLYSVTALVSGLASGLSVVLEDNGGNDLTVAANGSEAFTTMLANAAAYDVTVSTQPAGQTCTPQSGSGTIAAANVTVDVVCVYTSGDSALDGTYTGVGYTVLLNASPVYVVGSDGTTTFDGKGDSSASLSVNVNGGISTETNTGTYTLQNGQQLAGGVVAGGLEGANQNVLVGATVTAAANPIIGVSIKPGTGMSLAALAGTYISARFQASSTGATMDGGTLTINSDGSGTFSGSENDSGTIMAVTNSFPAGSFTLSSTGAFAISSAPVGVGAVSPDYQLAVSSNQTATDSPDMRVAVRTGSGESLATLDGQYSVVAYQDGLAGGDNGDVQALTVLADGQGHYTSSGTENSLGTISSETGSGTYTVADTGALTLTTADGTVLNGAVSQDGNVVVLYQVTSGKAPQIIAGVRQ